MHEQLRDALASNIMRVIDFFREWDIDGNGTISRDEFSSALLPLGLHLPKETYDNLFDEFDTDGSGDITLREFKRALKKVSSPKKRLLNSRKLPNSSCTLWTN